MKTEKTVSQETLLGTHSAREPIAIVGIGCRFPGAHGARELWDMLVSGRSAIADVPADRFDIEAFHDPRPMTRGKISSRRGGFMSDPFSFDADYFGISPREASRIDPQHRLMLEVCAEALHDAYLTKAQLAEETAGVYIGCWASDWECHEYADRDSSDVYSMAGSGRCLISGRVSFAFDLRGPSLTVDTGCSASLIATHLACQSLWLGECSVAVCGGVNLVLDPKPGISFSQGGMLAPDGACKAFDNRANGFVRSDGCGAVIMMPLSLARAHGARVYAVIRGSGASNDGFSNGLLATPSEIGQELAIRAAYRSAGFSPRDVHYVEAHGTGTRAGDPVELRAIGAVMKDRAADDPCWVGSIKTNIGHTEGAAGIAGLIKTALALHHRTIPQSLHFEAPTPLVAWDEVKLAVPTAPRPWPAELARAGVSSFGISGTDVHMLLEQADLADQPVREAAEEAREELLVISGHTEAALKAQAARYRALLTGAPADTGELRDICFSAALGREHHARRLAVAGTRPVLLGALEAYVAGDPHPALSVERASGAPPRTVFVFSGQGSQWTGMGLELLRREPVFRDALAACDAALRPHAGWSLLEELHRDRGAAPTPIDIIQPSIFAIQVGLAALLKSFGITPELVIGHSMGEVAAAHVAGILDLDDAARIICHRSRVLENVTGHGGMLSVELGWEDVCALVERHAGRVSVAAENGTHTSVLSGELGALAEITRELGERGVFCRDVQVAAAAHSPQLDPQLPGLRRVLDPVRPRDGASALICSTVTGSTLAPEAFDPDYWVRNMREPVRFCAALQWLLEQGYSHFVEISPHPVLLGPIQQIAQSASASVTAIQTLRREGPEREHVLGAVGKLHALGQAVDFRALFGPAARFVPLPSYAFQREPFPALPRGGSQPSASEAQAGSLGPALRSGLHPKTYLWQLTLSAAESSYLRDHAVAGEVTLPGASYVDMALQAAGQVFGSQPYVIEQLELLAALVIAEGASAALQVTLSRNEPGLAALQFLTEDPTSDGRYRVHARATARLRDTPASPPLPLEVDAIRSRCAKLELAEHFTHAEERGIHYGPAFRGLQELWVSEGEAFAHVVLPSSVLFRKGASCIHPALLDACWQAAASILFSQAASGAMFLPVEVESVQRHADAATELLAHAVLRTSAQADEVQLDVSLSDLSGNVVLETRGLKLRQLAAARSGSDDSLYGQAWRACARARAADREQDLSGQTWLLLMDRHGHGARVAEALEARGARCVRAYAAQGEPASGAESLTIDPAAPDALAGLAALATQHGPVHALVDLWPLDAAEEPLSEAALLDAQDRGAIGLTLLLQALGAADGAALRVWVVTRATQPVLDDDPILSAQAPLWGLARVLRVEQPHLTLQCIDLGAAGAEAELEQLLDELIDPDERFESQLGLRGAERFGLRVVREPLAREASQPLSAASAERMAARARAGAAYHLTMPQAGILDGLELREVERLPPGPGEVEIEVLAAGMNFIDVMKALGIYPGMDAGPIMFGGECAGRISALGSGVHGLEVGQRVIAMGHSARGCFARYAVTRAELVMPLPAAIDAVGGATIPAVFLTAHYALNHLGRLARGERVLIHSATGGVGLAAIQLARRAGAEIFATAGSEHKSKYLRELGIEHVFDSRSTEFAAQIRAVTHGEGVDVVLNSLAGAAIPASLELLRDDGRFLEIGKRDIYEDMQLGLLPFKRGLSFAHIDLARLARDRAALMGSLLRELMGMFEAGELQPLPHELFPISEAAAAFRHMAQAKHIGKIVLSTADEGIEGKLLPARQLARADASYLITGGLGGLGLVVAEWLADEGARHLVLVGRREPKPEALASIERLRARGVEVRVHAADVSQGEQVAALLREVQTSLPALRGVVHAAGLLDDGLAWQLTRERFLKVMAPKVLGAYHLHAQTAQLPLDFFVLFSSAATALGSPGQGNYAASNEFMDALAHARRRSGLPALAIDWGTWRETGLAVGAQRAGRLEQRGMGSLSNAAGVQLLGALMRSERTRAICVAHADFARWVQYNPSGGEGGMLDEVLRAQSERAPQSGIRARLLEAEPAERAELLLPHVSDIVRRVLCIPASKPLELDVPLNRFGIDSLMAVELKNRVDHDLGVALPVSKILLCTGLARLAEELAELIENTAGDGARGAPIAGAQAPAEQASAALDQLFTDIAAGSELLDDADGDADLDEQGLVSP